MKIPSLLCLLFFLGFWIPAQAHISIDSTDPQFEANVQKELTLMRNGKRGIVSQELVHRLDEASAPTVISPVTSDERTWHPNDRKGTRSHVVPQDTKVRGSARTIPTGALIYLHPSRIDPSFSLFKLGTFAQMLAVAMDLNLGTYPEDFKLQEKRSVFFRNAWRDSLGLELISLSDRVPTPEYEAAKKAGLIRTDQVLNFPILDPDAKPAPSPSESSLPTHSYP
jgi:hypothetical protein